TTIFAVAFAASGAIVARSRPANWIGWLLLLAGTLASLQLLTEEYAYFGALQAAGAAGCGVQRLVRVMDLGHPGHGRDRVRDAALPRRAASVTTLASGRL